jgi:protein-tyrosine phosphatase/Fe-S-cluster containining protein
MTESYTPTWIMPKLAVGHAPMSYDDLEALKRQGIDAILNLCGEYCDLHDIENDYGFDVYYLPIPDESIPDTQDLERALAWLDESIYLGKSVLVHCRFGIGRTGTLVTAYLMRRGLGLKSAAKLLKQTRANPSTYGQHKLLKKYGRKEKPLTIREPTLEDRYVVDLGEYFRRYEAIVAQIEDRIAAAAKGARPEQRCGRESDRCCCTHVDLSLMEAIYFNYRLNRHLKGEQRMEAVRRALSISRTAAQTADHQQRNYIGQTSDAVLRQQPNGSNLCSLSVDGNCLIYDYRPIACRLHGIPDERVARSDVASALQRLSNEVFFVYSGFFMKDPPLGFSLADTISGRFVQIYFYYLARQSPQEPVES